MIGKRIGAFGNSGCALVVAVSGLLGASCVEEGANEDVVENVVSHSLTASGPIALRALDARKSLAVTDKDLLTGFGFQRVMDRLVETSGDPSLDSLTLYQEWWGTNAVCTGGAFPFDCRQEAVLASTNPFVAPDTNPNSYVPLGLFNRFDLADPSGAHCGEHRVVFGKRSGMGNLFDRNLIIFEARYPNPRPEDGIGGCEPIVRFWARQSAIADRGKRRTELEKAYFVGAPRRGLPSIIHADHYGPSGGQIRTNQFMSVVQGQAWQLREYQIIKSCGATTCSTSIVHVTVKGNPFGELFDPSSSFASFGFGRDLVDSVRSLASDDLGFSMTTSESFNAMQSTESSSAESDYAFFFNRGIAAGNTDLQVAIEDRLTVLGSPLSAADVVARATATNCAGCHALSSSQPMGGGLVWPSSLGFVHIAENQSEVVDGVDRFMISPALTDVFLPERLALMNRFVRSVEANEQPVLEADGASRRRVH